MCIHNIRIIASNIEIHECMSIYSPSYIIWHHSVRATSSFVPRLPQKTVCAALSIGLNTLCSNILFYSRILITPLDIFCLFESSAEVSHMIPEYVHRNFFALWTGVTYLGSPVPLPDNRLHPCRRLQCTYLLLLVKSDRRGACNWLRSIATVTALMPLMCRTQAAVDWDMPIVQAQKTSRIVTAPVPTSEYFWLFTHNACSSYLPFFCQHNVCMLIHPSTSWAARMNSA